MDKTVYLIYVVIPIHIYNKILYFLPKHFNFVCRGNKYYGLYGWSFKKKMITEFLSFRNKNIYTLKEYTFETEDEYETFRKDNIELKLDYRVFVTKDKSTIKKVQLVTNKIEYVESVENASENCNLYILEKLSFVDYSIFKDKIIDALDVLNYTSLYDTYAADSDERSDSAGFNLSFNMTPLGTTIGKIEYDEFNLLLHLYNYLFFGESN